MFDEIYRELVTGDTVKNRMDGIEVDISPLDNSFVSTRPHNTPNNMTGREIRISNGNRGVSSNADGTGGAVGAQGRSDRAGETERGSTSRKKRSVQELIDKGKDFFEKNQDIIDSIRNKGANFKKDDGSGYNENDNTYPVPTPFYQKPSTYLVGVPLIILAVWGISKIA